MSKRRPASASMDPDTQPQKKAWERPRILSREPLEGVAVVCTGGTAKSDPFLCPSGPISS